MQADRHIGDVSVVVPVVEEEVHRILPERRRVEDISHRDAFRVLQRGGVVEFDNAGQPGQETGVPVFRAENPLTCVVLGTGRYLEELKYIRPK